MKLESLPSQYTPFQRVRLGSNVLENVTAIFSVNGFIPFLIGNGEHPKAWLSIPTNRDGTEWYPLIKDNFSSHSDVSVVFGKKYIKISTPQGTVLNAIKNKDDSIVVFKLDLRPFGLNVFSDETALQVMGNKLANNVFTNVQVVIGIGGNT